jgi:alkylhydroperoxidase/carboxymuconolactone decarboxylase family protein YurZ
MGKSASPPRAYRQFVQRYPQLGEAWESIRRGEEAGPLDGKTARLVKLGVAIGVFQPGAVHSAVRKALASGATRAEIEQVIALAAGTIGLPSTVAVDTWVQETLPETPIVESA